MIEYKDVPEEYDFGSEFDTWILAFCPDEDDWFATNKRFFFYEYPMEFSDEAEAIDYFVKNPKIFYDIEMKMKIYRPSCNEGGVWLDNIKELIKVELC